MASLLRWFADGHLTFLGYRHHVAEPDGTLARRRVGLGILRDNTRGADIGSVPTSRAAVASPW